MQSLYRGLLNFIIIVRLILATAYSPNFNVIWEFIVWVEDFGSFNEVHMLENKQIIIYNGYILVYQ